MSATNHQWILRRRPAGDVEDGDLVFEESAMPEPENGQIVVRTRLLSLDPANRAWMNETPSYKAPVPLNGPMEGLILGEVTASASDRFSVGDQVMGFGNWSEYCRLNATELVPVPELPGIPEHDVFGVFMLVGPTAYFGLHDICDPKAGETLVVTAAAGAVGSIAGQLGKAWGARVVGIAGGGEKCARVTGEFGMDAAIDYKNEDVAGRLDALCPDGIDCLFDNVGGEILGAVLARMSDFGRIAQCGAISMYNAARPVPGPYNYMNVVIRRLKIQGFIVTDFIDRYPEAYAELARLRGEGKLNWRFDHEQGLENALTAFRKLYSGANSGKMLLKVAD